MTLLVVIAILIVVVIVMFAYIKFTSRDVIESKNNLTQELFKTNPEFLERYIEDLSKDTDITENINSTIESKTKDLKKDLKKEMKKDFEDRINVFLAKEVKPQIRSYFKEEKVLHSTE